MLPAMQKINGYIKKHITSPQIIAIGFMVLILVGTLLLSLPISTRSGECTEFTNALFTATSASCVTGLAVFDTYTYWSIFGQCVILVLIQIGGLGFMSMVTMFSIALRRNIGLSERKLIMDSTANFNVGGVVALMKRIVIGTFFAEAVGAAVLSIRFCSTMGVARGIYNAVFHSISAFCNAGFDLMGRYGKFSSFAAFKTDPLVNIVIMLLILCGGLGFIVWSDILCLKGRFKKFHLHSKLVLVMTAVLVLVPALLFFIFEYNMAFKGESIPNKVLLSFFSAVTPRTAGFSTINLNELSDSGTILTTILMIIGAGSGSTGGGIKITTVAVLVLSFAASARHNPQAIAFKRKIEDTTVRQASAIFFVYFWAIIGFTMVICALEPFSLKDILFESSSAIGTVGLSMGITPMLRRSSKILLAMLMFAGRIGGMTLVLSLAARKNHVPIDRPAEKVMLG